MSVKMQAFLLVTVFIIGNVTFVFLIFLTIRGVLKFISPSFRCTGKIIDKGSNMKSYSDVRGSTSYINTYYVTLETIGGSKYTYSVNLDVFADLELESTYKFFINCNEINEYERTENVI